MTDNVTSNASTQRHVPKTANNQGSKKILIGLLVAFILPVVLAKIALEQDWFNRAATNKGELIEPTVDVSPIVAGLTPKWRMIFVLPQTCSETCKNAIFSMQQVWLALGRENDRVEALIVITENSDVSLLNDADAMRHINTVTTSKENVNKLFNTRAANGIFIADTQNNAMLRFSVSQDKQQAIMESRDMLSDIKKLLKLSRIG